MQQYYQQALQIILRPTESDTISQCYDVDQDKLESKYDEYFQLADEKLHVFPFKDVKACWFRLYTDTSIIKAIKLIPKDGERNGGTTGTKWLDNFVSILDMALIMAGGLGREDMIHNLLAEFRSDFLCKKRLRSDDNDDGDDENETNTATLLPQAEYSIPTIDCPVQQLHTPAWLEFSEYMHKQAQPAVLHGILDDWPAMKHWNKLDYWHDLTLQGRRLVPVELGRSYVDEEWGQEIMPFRSFLDRHIVNHESTDKTGYLAQHDLFRQIRGLRADAPVPDYCYLDTPLPLHKRGNIDGHNGSSQIATPDELSRISSQTKFTQGSRPIADKHEAGKGSLTFANKTDADAEVDADAQDHDNEDENGDAEEEDYDDKNDDTVHTNIWFGPPWTISPLHHDPYHNILCQAVGKKYIRLYSPDQSTKLFPRSATEPAPHLQQGENKRAASTIGSTTTTTTSSAATAVSEGETKATIDMSNTSTVDIAAMQLSPDEDWDEVYPGISTVPYQEVVLEAGQALYIPVGWWHFVRSCSVGISVSFWWN